MEWKTNVRKDTYNSLQGHSATLEYLTLANDAVLTKQQMRIALLRKMADLPESKKRPHEPEE